MVYVVHYWGGNEKLHFPDFSGRAEPVMMLLEYAGIKYQFKRYDITAAQKPFSKYLADELFPAQACPVLTDDDNFSLSQTVAIMHYLGHKYDVVPEGEYAQANCLQMALNAADIWAEGYKERQKADEGEEFLNERLQMWIDIVEKSMAKFNGKFAFGNKPSYCDFEMLNSFRVLEYCYGKKTLNQYYTPGIERYLKNVLELPQIVNYFNNTPQGKENVLYPGVDYGSSKRARL